MSNEDDINFPGPNLEYRPETGGASSFDPTANPNLDLLKTYADLDLLNDLLNQLATLCAQFEEDLENELRTLSLAVTDTPPDAKLRDALSLEWPTQLGPVKNIVTYRYYVYLENRSSSAAIYIRQRYEQAARDVTGTNAIDLIGLVKLIQNEIGLIREFLTVHVGTLNDSSERRVVELLQNWAQSAIDHTRNLRNLYKTRDSQRKLPDSDVSQIGQDEAVNAQAVFKVTLNQVNLDLQNTIKLLTRNFNDFSDVFYHNFLGPALSFRTNITKNITPILPGRLGQEINNATSALNGQLSLILADLVRRNNFFSSKMTDLETQITVRDNYRSFIKQLSSVGRNVVTGTTGTLVPETDTSDEASFFSDLQQLIGSQVSGNPFESPHSSLSGIDDPAAHPQYLNLGGGTLTGPVGMAEGASIDGSVPSIHAHKGVTTDGTQQISGQDILPGTLTSNLISTSDKPITPVGLRVDQIVKHVDSSGLGAVSYDITFAWEGDVGDHYEVQVSELPAN